MKKLLHFFIRIGILFLLLGILIMVSLFKKNPEVCESLTRGISRFYGSIVTKVSGVVPFSLTEVFFVSIVGLGILLLIFAIINLIKLRFFKALYRVMDIAIIALLTISVYDFSCEFAYHRQEIPLPYYQGDVQREEHVDIYNYFADDLNYCVSQLEFKENGDVKTSMSLKEITNEVKKAYSIIEGNSYYHPFFGSVKPMVSSFIYREFQITGVTFASLGEANINTLNTQTDIPFTVAHELAHTKGVMREDDANKLAFYVCLNSEHPYLRYASYVAFFSQLEGMTSSYYLTDEEKIELHPVNDAFYKTRNHEYKYWQEHDLLGDIGDWVNDLYIKMSGVKEGTSSYSGGTNYEHDPTTSKLIPSLYQKLFFEKYYR